MTVCETHGHLPRRTGRQPLNPTRGSIRNFSTNLSSPSLSDALWKAAMPPHFQKSSKRFWREVGWGIGEWKRRRFAKRWQRRDQAPGSTHDKTQTKNPSQPCREGKVRAPNVVVVNSVASSPSAFKRSRVTSRNSGCRSRNHAITASPSSGSVEQTE